MTSGEQQPEASGRGGTGDTEREERVTPLELFFDLVFVYAITQVTTLMSSDLTWRGVGRGLLVLAALWWAWTGYAWLTNILEPEEGPVRVGMLAGMGAMLIAALAVPRAFGADAVLFGIAYVAVRLLNLGLDGIAAKRDPDFFKTLLRFGPIAAIGPALIVAAGFTDGAAQTALWVLAVAAIYVAPIFDRGRGWRLAPRHFAERYGLIVIIALGESIVAIGFGAAGVSIDPPIVAAALLGLGVIAALWWAYFDVYAVLAEQTLAGATGVMRTRLARDYYSYLHMPMIAGIVLFAMGLKLTTKAVDQPLATVPAVAMCGGLSLYYWTHVVMRLRHVRYIRRTSDERPPWIGPGRLAAAIGSLALIPVALHVPALAALASLAALCWALIVWDVVHYREHRVQVRRERH
jgi:low temperature requirement protein LtrA